MDVPAPDERARTRSWRQMLPATALIVLVFGVLPFAWDAPPVWQAIGLVVAIVFAARWAQVTWQQLFSTAPRHLG